MNGFYSIDGGDLTMSACSLSANGWLEEMVASKIQLKDVANT
jgi:hypothetical protein